MAMEKAASFLSSLLLGGGGGGGGSPEPAATVQSITVYPIKSCRGISVPQATITATWFRWGQQWMVVNAKGRAVTQRMEPSLALVEVDMPPEAFADAEDLWLLQASLDALNEIPKEPVPMNSFRPDILVDGCHPYSEDLWKTVEINKLTFMGVRLCDRCKIPNIDQEKGNPRH